jgi:5-methylcytosine-specific restriction endonuclease McrA
MTPEQLLLAGRGTPRQRFEALRKVFRPEHALMLQRLDYFDFLRTPYWRIVSRHVRIQRGACNRCGARSGLQAHHLTYEHHGWEHEHLDDLEVLCRDCHRVEHRQVPTAGGEWRSVGELMPETIARINREMEAA